MNSSMRSSRLRRFARADGGVSAVEFALLLPLFLVMFFGGYAVCEAVSISRKVMITTRAIADLVTKYTSMSTSDMTMVLNASAQIIAPFSSAPLGLRVSQITTGATGLTATVTWSAASNATAYTCKSNFTLPTALLGSANTSYIYSEVFYTFTPVVGASIVKPFSLSDSLYMIPRLSTSVTYACS